jgi:sulfane dehydrogenase subunit SoxC
MRTPALSLVEVSRRPFNAETPLAALLEEVTPAELVYVRNNFDVPEIDPAGWTLSVGGAVGSPRTLGLAEIQALPATDRLITMECAGNARARMSPVPSGTPWCYGAVSVVRFTGARLADVLGPARLASDAVELVFTGADRGEVEPGGVVSFQRSMTIADATSDDVILAWAMNGAPLTAEHGAPLRLVVPGAYGMASVKWVQSIEAVRVPFTGHFQTERYIYVEEPGIQDGEPVRRMRVRSLILDPCDGTTLDRGAVEIRGIAWSGHATIARVEVSTDGGGTWKAAELGPATSAYATRGWRHAWTPPGPGRYRLTCRASDAIGNTQPLAQVWNRLGYGNNGPHSVDVTIA